MNIETTEMSQSTVLRPDDGLDLLGYQALAERIGELLREGRTKLVLDLGDVTYVSSPVVTVLRGAAAKVKEAGGALALANVEGGAKLVLEASGTLKTLPFYATVEDAARALSGQNL